MTREQKLALIVGFSLILFVGVLISDHLSSARKAQIGKVEPEAPVSPLALGTVPAPGPALEPRTAAPGPSVDPLQLIMGGSPKPADPAPALENRIATGTPETTPAPNTAAPIQQPQTRMADGTLSDEIRRAGGELVRGPDGSATFRLPPAADTRPVSQMGPPLLTDRRTPANTPINTAVGPIEPIKTHTVRSGETLFQITNRYYGNGNLWCDLAKFNGMDKAGTVRLGAQIKIPSKDVLTGRAVATKPAQSVDPSIRLIAPAGAAPAVKPPTPKAQPAPRGKAKIELASYTVRKGDTLGEISLRTLGTSRRWQEIAELNSLDDEDSIPTGTVLKIPASRS